MPPAIFFSLPFRCSPDFAFLRVFAKSLPEGAPAPFLVIPNSHRDLTGHPSRASRGVPGP